MKSDTINMQKNKIFALKFIAKNNKNNKNNKNM